MADMFDNLKNRGSITRNPRSDGDNGQRNWVPGGNDTRCSQCKNEHASGSAKMSDGSWKRIGPSCRRAMGFGSRTPRGNGAGHTGTHSPDSKPHRVGDKRGRPKVVKVDSERLDK